MNVFALLIAFSAGAAVGGLYFSLLWLSVRGLTGGGPKWHFVAGAIARAALVIGTLAVFLVLARPMAELAAAAAGFLGARLVATRLAKRSESEG